MLQWEVTSAEGKEMHFDTDEAGQAVLSRCLQVQSKGISILRAQGFVTPGQRNERT